MTTEAEELAGVRDELRLWRDMLDRRLGEILSTLNDVADALESVINTLRGRGKAR